MIAVDTNILVHAHREDSEWHDRAFNCIRSLAEGVGNWAIPWPCIHEFLAVVTHPKIFSPPTPLQNAIDQVDAWMESPGLVMLSESEVYWDRLKSIILTGRVSGPRVHDARIAAICRLHGVRQLWTADRDFSRFAKLQTLNPLLSEPL